MLRIAEVNSTATMITLQLDGRLAGKWVLVLEASCEEVFRENRRLTLDMSGVDFADHDGVGLLRRLERQQVTLINCSPFLREQLKHQQTI